MTLDRHRVMISKLSRSTLASVLKEQYRGMLFVATKWSQGYGPTHG
jgi:hypothetical protein